MSFNLLEIIDPHRLIYEANKLIIKKIADQIPLKRYQDNKSKFRYYYDDYLVNIYQIKDLKDCTHKTFITCDIDLIAEAKKKNADIMLIFAFEEKIYYWKYKESEIALGYGFNSKRNNPTVFHLMTCFLIPLECMGDM